ncbi:hypothetical protein E2C01_063321 [Portunus trituberculatus]|uniref:Uncharacterized protein n=1 Tax=Portunus trituberculatus TaxID=210409 RepID=A0A5B7HGR4_PORTR|nr:hypothetical protein [Portunus trituberculatus]
MVGLPVPPSLTHPTLPAPPRPAPPVAPTSTGLLSPVSLDTDQWSGAGGRLRWRYERGHVRPGCVKRDGAFWYLMAWRMGAGGRGAGTGLGWGGSAHRRLHDAAARRAAELNTSCLLHTISKVKSGHVAASCSLHGDRGLGVAAPGRGAELDTISGVLSDAASRVHLLAAGNTRTRAAPLGWGVQPLRASTVGSNSSSTSRQACRAAGPRGATAHFSSPLRCVPCAALAATTGRHRGLLAL